MGLARRDRHHHTYGEYSSWGDDARYELIDGAAYLVSPAPDVRRQDVVGEVFRQIANQLIGHRCRVFIAPIDVRLPRTGERDEQVDTVVQPDLLVVCDPDKIDRRGVRGPPDWVLEVLSPSTAAHDQVNKRAVYERAGVAELWLAHPTDLVLSIYRLGAGGEYGKPEIVELDGQTPVGAVPGVVVTWRELVARIAPE